MAEREGLRLVKVFACAALASYHTPHDVHMLRTLQDLTALVLQYYLEAQHRFVSARWVEFAFGECARVYKQDG